ncbi:MAG: endonuclease/exonuclease/phosphatase family protein [Gemmatimonadaceae bacterium]|nr:endonuclease/exonuclease/phosphatase family protein [Gemmatimonadaceae bacterium]
MTIVRTLMLLVLVTVTGCFPARRGDPADPGDRITVMTYNIQYGGGGTNLAGITGAIRAIGPDIVALQEVDVRWSSRSEFADQAAVIAEALGMHVRFAPIYDIPDSAMARPARQFGVAILSRHPIIRFSNHPQTRHSTQEPSAPPRPQPGLLEAIIDVRGQPVRVFNTHLDYRPDPEVRRRQVAEMLDIIGIWNGPMIVFGDLNAAPDAPEIAPLFARFRDAWPRGADPGFTMPSTAPSRRIDYVLVSDDIRVARAVVPVTTASDHRPVLLDLIIPRR